MAKLLKLAIASFLWVLKLLFFI